MRPWSSLPWNHSQYFFSNSKTVSICVKKTKIRRNLGWLVVFVENANQLPPSPPSLLPAQTHKGKLAQGDTRTGWDQHTRASVTLNSLRMYWGMLYSAIGSTTKYWYLAERSAGQYWWHFSYRRKEEKEGGGKIWGTCIRTIFFQTHIYL